MQKATKEILAQFDAISEKRIQEIRDTKDTIQVSGAVYYVSNAGDDTNDGLSAQKPWKTLQKVTDADLKPGDGVCFQRGDLFRGEISAKAGVTYFAYGEGEKPRFYGWDKNLADPELWILVDAQHHIWKWNEPILDCGTLVFNAGQAHCRKLIPSYMNGQFVCRDDESRLFDMAEEMTEDLDLFWRFDDELTTSPSKGEDFPVPVATTHSLGELYLRCDQGNPALLYADIEAIVMRKLFSVGDNANIKIDNLCLKYANFAVGGGGFVDGLHVTNCEIGWIGGCIQHYFGTDPNYPQGRRGTVTRFGNGIEIYGGCNNYVVENCYIYQSYDAGMTHQVTTTGTKYTMTNILYKDNVVEKCVYAIEYFLEKLNGETASHIDNCEMCGNILRLSGYGWGQQRHNTHTPAHIKGWSYENTARNFSVHHNIFDRSAYRMIHMVAKEKASCAQLYENTYIQKYGMTLGSYGAYENGKVPTISFFDDVEKIIWEEYGDKDAKVFYLE